MIHQEPTIVLPVAAPTPNLPHIYLPIQDQSVPVPPVSPPVPSQRVPVSQPTPPHRVQKEFSTPKPWSSTPPVQNKSTPKN